MEEKQAGADEGKPSRTRSVAQRFTLWEQLIAFGRVNLGLSLAEFMAMTPRLFEAHLYAYQQAKERDDRARNFGITQVIAMIANTGFYRYEKPRQPQEFEPRYPSDMEAVATTKRRRNEAAFTRELERTMERAMRYQKGQVDRSLDS